MRHVALWWPTVNVQQIGLSAAADSRLRWRLKSVQTGRQQPCITKRSDARRTSNACGDGVVRPMTEGDHPTEVTPERVQRYLDLTARARAKATAS